MSRLENRIIQIQRKDSDLRSTLCVAADQIQRQTEEKGIVLCTDFPEKLLYFHDANWMDEAVGNLLDNAVKYSRTGGRVEFGASSNEMFVHIWVRDYGEGMEKGEESLVFQRFYRGKNAAGKEGFGIGLTIAREIILQHHGFMKIKREETGTRADIYLNR